ncbi:MAG: hypothetical protein E7585_02370 [Ruminococcaceae bacterium]|nr:hypothetical protein [Oscillospiraceae bacterium]
MNKNVGIMKEIDSLGRIVIPKEFRERLMLEGCVELILTADGVLIRNTEYKLVKRESRHILKR